jgi:hypothetical protein
VWSAPERNPWLTTLTRLLVEHGHTPPPPPTAPGPFSMANPAHTQALIEAAGFTTVRLEETPVQLLVRDIDDYLAYATDTAGPLALVLRELPDSERRTIGNLLDQALTPFANDHGYSLPGISLNAVASPLESRTQDDRFLMPDM